MWAEYEALRPHSCHSAWGQRHPCRGGAAKMEVNTCSLFDDFWGAIADMLCQARRRLKHYIALGNKIILLLIIIAII